MKCSRRGFHTLGRLCIALLLALPVSRVSAGSCCVGATTAMPGRAGPCENFVAGLAVGAEAGLGQWDSGGTFGSRSLEEDSGRATLGAAWRFSHFGQLALSVPFQLSYKQAGELQSAGGGLGDVRAFVVLNPLEEPMSSARVPVELLAVPYVTVGIRLPTGASWQDSDDPLLADVTGLPGTTLLLGASLERTAGRIPWSLGIDAELPVTRDASRPLIAASASLGHYIGSRWSVVGTIRHARTPADPAVHDLGTAQTSLGARAVYGRPMAWRTWAGVDSSVPVSALGRLSPAVLSFSVGWALVR